MFVSFALLAAAQLNQVVIPFGKQPRIIEQPIAPIQTNGPLWARQCKDWDEWNKPADVENKQRITRHYGADKPDRVVATTNNPAQGDSARYRLGDDFSTGGHNELSFRTAGILSSTVTCEESD